MLVQEKHYRKFVQIGLNIMRYRKERGLTQEQLADLTDYSRNQIQRVETANAAPTMALLFDVAEALKVSVEQLIEIRQ